MRTRAVLPLIALALVLDLGIAGDRARAAPAPPAAAVPAEEVRLAPGPMAATVQALCSACHSADYLPMNSPFLDRAGWEAEVRKMMRVMGAPVPEDQVGAVVDYLTQNYGAR